MAARRTKGRSAKTAAPLEGSPAPVAATRSGLLSFLERHSPAIAIILIALASFRVISTYSRLSVTFDEPGHFACGLEYLSKHIYRYEAQHPPLARAMMALGPYLDGVRLRGNPNRDK